MLELSLQATPNQTFSALLDGARYQITLRDIGSEVMAVDIARDEVPVIQGARCVPGVPLIPYRALENGNFMFDTLDDAYPYWPEFGVTQTLFYLTVAETEALRGSA